jgi:hypothetical protein
VSGPSSFEELRPADLHCARKRSIYAGVKNSGAGSCRLVVRQCMIACTKRRLA